MLPLRRRAEPCQPLTCGERRSGWLIEPAGLIAHGQAQRLAEVRKSSGHGIPQLAGLLGISYEAYEDLERFVEEIVDAISLDQLIRLVAALRLDLRSFFNAENLAHVTFAEFAIDSTACSPMAR